MDETGILLDCGATIVDERIQLEHQERLLQKDGLQRPGRREREFSVKSMRMIPGMASLREGYY